MTQSNRMRRSPRRLVPPAGNLALIFTLAFLTALGGVHAGRVHAAEGTSGGHGGHPVVPVPARLPPAAPPVAARPDIGPPAGRASDPNLDPSLDLLAPPAEGGQDDLLLLPPPDSSSPEGNSPTDLGPNPAHRANDRPGQSGSRSVPSTAAPDRDRPYEPDSSNASAAPGQPDPHLALFAENQYPSARQCAECHPDVYREWSISSHAYAAVSPMFHKFEQAIQNLSQGTVGYFCMRCHSPVGTSMGWPRHASILEAPEVAREGVTCIACHRVRERYGLVNGERRIEPGSIFEPVTGRGTGSHLSEVLAKKDYYKVKTSPEETGPGQPIHQAIIPFEQISSSHFCASCHQVSVYPGIDLEIVWAQYRASPAAAAGISCQDCHMGRVPGKPEGYATAPIAIVADKPIGPGSKHANHTFFGPGYSIAHPGIFPFRAKPSRWSPAEWLLFDWRSGWGSDEFETRVARGEIKVHFPEVWSEVDDRMDAWEQLQGNLARLKEKDRLRHELMEQSSHLDGPFFDATPRLGQAMRFHYAVSNINNGHNLPSGSLGAQPQVWLNVVLTGPDGRRLWESGYVDTNGDMADLHSLDVAAGRVLADRQLFNLQTKFLITGIKGTDREAYLPINTDIDQLPFIRPSGLPISVLNHPPLIRLENHSLPPLGTRKARYRVPGHLLRTPGRYRLSARMRYRAEPIYFMRFCLATPEMERAMNEGALDFHQQAVEFVIR